MLWVFFFLFKYPHGQLSVVSIFMECPYKLKRLVDPNLSVALKKKSAQ